LTIYDYHRKLELHVLGFYGYNVPEAVAVDQTLMEGSLALEADLHSENELLIKDQNTFIKFF